MSSNKAAKFIAVWMMAMAGVSVGISAIGAMFWVFTTILIYIHDAVAPYITHERVMLCIVVLMAVGLPAAFAYDYVYGDEDE